MSRRLNWRKIKTHRSYTVDEAARSLGACKGTVRRWLRVGLPALADQRPALILGSDLVDFVRARRKARHKCQLYECYCLKCRVPRRPAFNAVEYHPITATSGNLRALCEVCASVMHKRMPLDRLAILKAILDVTVKQANDHLSELTQPSSNVHFATGSKCDA